MKHTENKAFSLVELMVVIAVIAILAGLFLPVLSSAKHRTRGMVCINNQRQNGLRFCLLLMDDKTGQSWYTTDGLYNQNYQGILLCPEATIAAGVNPFAQTRGWGNIETAWVNAGVTCSYGFNIDLYWLGQQGLSIDAKIVRPSETPFVVDATTIEVGPWPNLSPTTMLPATDLYTGTRNGVLDEGFPAMNIPRHGNRPAGIPRDWSQSQPLPGAVNVGLLDGHVEVTKLDYLWDFIWYPGYQPPAKRPGLL